MELPELRGARLVECPSRHRGCHKYELTPCTGITLSRLPPPLAAYWPSSDCARSLAQFVWSGGSVRDRVNQREPSPNSAFARAGFPYAEQSGQRYCWRLRTGGIMKKAKRKKSNTTKAIRSAKLKRVAKKAARATGLA